MKQLLEAGVHFGHQTRRWNPKMAEYIYCERNGIYIIDLQKTVKKLEEAYNFVRTLAENGQTILFVGTKKQAADAVKEEASRVGMYYVNARWLGGMLTNFKTMRTRIDRLAQLKKMQYPTQRNRQRGKAHCGRLAVDQRDGQCGYRRRGAAVAAAVAPLQKARGGRLMKRLFLQIFAWLAILLGVGLMLQPTVSRYLTEQKSTKTVQKFVQAAEAAAPAAPETSAAEPARAYPELYDAFLAYNQQLFAQGQSSLKDQTMPAFSPICVLFMWL